MANLFKDQMMQKEYDAAIGAYGAKHRDLFFADGKRRKSPDLGSSFATYFWAGYDGLKVGLFSFNTKSSRNTIAYAHYRAGQDAARQ